MHKRIWVYRWGYKKFSMRSNGAPVGYFYRDEHPEGNGMVCFHATDDNAPDYWWLLKNRPSESQFK